MLDLGWVEDDFFLDDLMGLSLPIEFVRDESGGVGWMRPWGWMYPQGA